MPGRCGLFRQHPNSTPVRGDRGCARRAAASWTVCAVTTVLLLSSGCVQEMANQPRVDTYEVTRSPEIFEDGLSFRAQIPGTIARGQIWEQNVENTGRDASGLIARIPLDVNEELVQRGRQRFEIYCRHCHGYTGGGDGMVVQRGFTIPPAYHIDRLKTAPDGHLFEVIGNGIGRMPGFKERILPKDRWAIVAYVRALQLSQSAPVDQLEESDRKELSAVSFQPTAGSSQPAAVGEQPPAESAPSDTNR